MEGAEVGWDVLWPFSDGEDEELLRFCIPTRSGFDAEAGPLDANRKGDVVVENMRSEFG